MHNTQISSNICVLGSVFPKLIYLVKISIIDDISSNRCIKRVLIHYAHVMLYGIVMDLYEIVYNAGDCLVVLFI